MSITVLSDVIMPNTLILAGLSGRTVRNNRRGFNQGGFGSINVNWSEPLREFDLGFIPSLTDVWKTIEGLFEVTEAGAYGFLMEDPKDARVSLSEGALQPYNGGNVGTIGVGYGVPTYRLYKRYAAYGTSRIDDRYISRPRLPLTSLRRAGVDVTLGASPGNAAISGATVTFVPDATALVTAVTPGVTTTIELGSGLGLAIGGRLWLQDMTGSGAALLNNLSHEITNLVGNVYTLATNTNGASINVSGGGRKYPQPSESLAWSGSFYVPVHFVNDELAWVLERSGPIETRLIRGESILLREVRE